MFPKITAKIIGVIAALGISLSGFSLPANAASELVFTPVLGAYGNETYVGVKADGTLFASKDNRTWTIVNGQFNRNGITSISFDNGKFFASGYFQFGMSDNGYDWEVVTLPIGKKFNPGNIISDEEFFSSPNMSADEIQEFLLQKSGPSENPNALINYKETTKSLPANEMCDAYKGRIRQTAASIIYNVSKACNVGVEVIITTLQKEQGLVTNPNPSNGAIDRATGFACPDTGDCDKDYLGFFNQVYNSAKQFVRYTNPEGTKKVYTWFEPGRTKNVLWQVENRYNPETKKYDRATGCGGSSVLIENQATAGLYYYTPYQPNAAALKSFDGLGDDCSAYGNRNFWRIYNLWFSKTRDYGTYVAHFANTYIAVSQDGELAASRTGKGWSKQFNLSLPEGTIVTGTIDTKDSLVLTTSNPELVYITYDGRQWQKRVGNDLVFEGETSAVLSDDLNIVVAIRAALFAISDFFN